MLKFAVLFLMAFNLFAESKGAIQIEGAQFRPFRIAVPDVTNKKTPAAIQLISLIRNDLELSGVFQVLNPDSYINAAKIEDWSNIGAEGLVKTELTMRSNDELVIKLSIHQLGASRQSKTISYMGKEAEVRRLAHRISDDIYQFFTGDPGIFSSKIAVAKKVGDGKQIFVMDMDGANQRQVTKGKSINILPAFSLDGDVILYTNYANNNPDLYEIGPDGRGYRKISSYPGLNVGGTLSPDKKTICVTLSKDGNAEIYLLDRNGKILKQLTKTGGINTSPAWSPDGKQIAFVSNRSGNPHVFVMNADGNDVRRLTFQGKYNQQPRWNAKGTHIVMTSRDEESIFDIFVIEVATGKISRVTQDQGRNEDPWFAPNGRQLVFISDRSGKREIYISSIDGSFQKKLTNDGDYFSPTWAPQKV